MSQHCCSFSREHRAWHTTFTTEFCLRLCLPEPLQGLCNHSSKPEPPQANKPSLNHWAEALQKPPRGTSSTQSRIQGWNSLSLGPNRLTEGDQTNSCREIPAQAPEHEDQTLICSQEASKAQLEAEPASWGQHPTAPAGCCCSFHGSFPQTPQSKAAGAKGRAPSALSTPVPAHTPHISIFPRHSPSRTKILPRAGMFFSCAYQYKCYLTLQDASKKVLIKRSSPSNLQNKKLSIFLHAELPGSLVLMATRALKAAPAGEFQPLPPSPPSQAQ